MTGINVRFDAIIYIYRDMNPPANSFEDLGLRAAQSVKSTALTIASRFGLGCLDEKTLSQAADDQSE